MFLVFSINKNLLNSFYFINNIIYSRNKNDSSLINIHNNNNIDIFFINYINKFKEYFFIHNF